MLAVVKAEKGYAAQILPSVMPDGLHPVAAGMESLAQCLAPIVDKHFDDV